MHDVARAMQTRGFEVAVALGGTGEPGATPGRLHEVLTQAGIRTLTVRNFTRDIFILREVLTLRELVNLFTQERPDIVHLNSSKAGLLGSLAARIAGVPCIIFTVHGWPWSERHRSFWWRIMALKGSWLSILLSHQVISVSEFDRIEGSRLPFSSGKIMTIYNGCGPLSLESRESARRALLPHASTLDGIWLGTVGELHQNKGIDLAIKAVGNLHRKGIVVNYIIIGEGEERETLETLIATEGIQTIVHLVGSKLNAAKLLSAFDLFVLPDRKTGFSYVLLEAGSAGLPVVATSVGGIPEIIQDDVNGKLVAPEDVISLTAGLRELLDNATKREQFGATLKAMVHSQFGHERMMEETVALYRAKLNLHA